MPESDCLIFDFDSIATIKDILAWFGKYEKIIATTKNHQKEKNGLTCDRFRLILPCDSIIDLDRYNYVILMRYLTNRWNADTQAIDAGRKFLGFTGSEVIYTQGQKLDWKTFYYFALSKENERKQLLEKQRKKYQNESDSILNPEKWERAFKPQNIATGERNNQLARIAFWVKDSGGGIDTVLSALEFVNARLSMPLNDKELAIIARSKFKRC